MTAVVLAGALVGCAVGGGATATSRPSCPTAAPSAGQASSILAGAGQAVVTTGKGRFTIQLLGDAAPIATANFVALARCGFYDGITFHRVIAGFVAQAGDPQTKGKRGDFDGLGTGGPGYQFAIEQPPASLHYDQYVVAMANAGRPDTNGSQFFIDLADVNDSLTANPSVFYTIIGRVTSGTDVVDAIGLVPTTGQPHDVPLEPVVIQSIAISGS